MTTKNRWLREIETGLEQIADECRRRKGISVVDPVADGMAYAIGEIRARLTTLTAPGQELTPAEWGAEQEPPISEQCVRNWIRSGELEARQGPKGFRVAAMAVRVKKGEKHAA